MKKVKGKIILIDDSPIEKNFLEESLDDQNWDIRIDYFSKSKLALEHLLENVDDIFLIISDMNMPEMSGLDLKKIIDEDSFLREKAIPFIFMSSEINLEDVRMAYAFNVQGFFKKPDTIEEQAKMLEKILKYWQTCIHPNKKFSPYSYQ